MQEKRSTVASNSGMDQQIYRNNFPLNPVETQNLTKFLLSPCDTNTSYVNAASQESASLSIWNSGASSSNEHPLNQSSRDETKVENGRASSLTINMNEPGDEEEEFEADNMLSLENVDLNLTDDEMENDQLLSQNPTSDEFMQNFDHNVGHVGRRTQVLEEGLYPHPHPYNSGLLESGHASVLGGSSIIFEDSSEGVGFLSEDVEGRAGGSADGPRLSRKRKNIEDSARSSAGSSSYFRQSENSSLHSVSYHNPNTSLNISGSSNFMPVVNPPPELNPRIGSLKGLVSSDRHPSGPITGNAESSRRNIRMRINPSVYERDTSAANPWHPGNSSRHSNVWSMHQPSSLPLTLNESLESWPVVAGATSQSQSHVPTIPNPGLSLNVRPCAWSGVSNSRVGSSSSTLVIPGEQMTSPREDPNSRNTPRNNIADHSLLIPPTETRNLVPPQLNWVLDNGSAAVPGNMAPPSRSSTTSGVHQPRSTTWVPHQIPPARVHRRLSEAVHRSLLQISSNPTSGGQSSNVIPRRSSHSTTSQDIGRPSRVGFHGLPQPIMRSAVLMDRQRDGISVSARTLTAAREARSMSENLRNMLDLMRSRGDNFRIEDLFIFDHSGVPIGGGYLHDRHRDMRLDVDNMSYEELLALEERIGNVSTGLSEETVSKCLKLWKYSSSSFVSVEAEVSEPCCICQEEYVDGEELGKLDCGHDFHSRCINQWLKQKNLCPICKTTALSKT